MLDELEVARELCLLAHRGQLDKGGKPYYEHPFRMAENFDTSEGKIVSFLHDVVEDEHISLDQLKYMGFKEEIIESIDAISRREEEKYTVYTIRVSQNTLAKKVKIEDLKDNLRKDRWCWGVRDDSNWHWKRYTEAYKKLTGEDYDD